MSKVSIITPCYNAEKFVGKAIESVLRQSFTDWEYIIVDDGSTDNSAEVIASYIAIEPRLQLIRQSNSGLAVTRNNGFQASSPESEYILFFDADDCLEPQMLEVMVKYLNQHPQVGVAYCDFYNIDENDQPINTVYSPRLVPSFFGLKTLPYDTPETPLLAIAAGLGGGTDGRCVFRRRIYEQTSGWDEKLGRNGGHILDILAQCALISEVHFIPHKLHQYRLHSNNQLHINVNFQAQSQKILNKWKEGTWLTPDQKAQVTEVIWFYEKRLIPFVNILSAKSLIQAGQILPAFSLCFQAAQRYFMSFLTRPL